MLADIIDMDYFYMTVGSVAIVFLIILLILVGVVIKRTKKDISFEPASCPDGWIAKVTSSGTGGSTTPYVTACQLPTGVTYTDALFKNFKSGTTSKSIDVGYNSTNGTIQFTGPEWQGKTGLCNKYQWATTNGYASASGTIHWDGITNVRSQC